MTDRLHSCIESPNGRHNWVLSLKTGPALVATRISGCSYCGKKPPAFLSKLVRVGWNVPLEDPDAHLGTVGGE